MRMWCVPPSKMCRQHLLGEHKELHMLVGCLNKGKSLKGYYDRELVDTRRIVGRHLEIVQEMERRGYNHNSPLPGFDDPGMGRVDVDKSVVDLRGRCRECEV